VRVGWVPVALITTMAVAVQVPFVVEEVLG
jgi:hypothetical protein